MTAFPHDSLHPFAALQGVKPVSNDTTISIVELEGEEISDENLMIAHQAGDERAFPMLLERYRSDLHRYLQRFLGSASAADDVFQETFLQIHLSAASFDVTRKLRPWLYTIASNKARDWYRHHKRRATLSLDKPMGHGETEFTLLDVVASTDSQPGDAMSSLEESTRVKKVVDALPELHREILLMAYFQRFSYQHISDMLGIPLGTVKSRLHSAVALFADGWAQTTHETLKDHS
jgi:RNA polymerase sigma-70 factor (ECF subfamily)